MFRPDPEAQKPKVIVQLAKPYLNLNPGEIAGLDPEVARQLVTQNAAVLVETKAEPAKAGRAAKK